MQLLGWQLREWLYEHLDEHDVRLCFAAWRLVRTKFRKSRARKNALLASNARVPVERAPVVQARRVSCLCVSSAAEVREYGKAYAVSNYSADYNGRNITACSSAWFFLVEELAANNRHISYGLKTKAQDSLTFQTVGGAITVTLDICKHDNLAD